MAASLLEDADDSTVRIEERTCPESCSIKAWKSGTICHSRRSEAVPFVSDTNGTAAKFVWNLRSVMTRVDRGKNFFVIAPR